MRVSLPTKGGHSLHTERWDTIGDNLEPIRLILDVKDLEARDGNNASDDIVLLLEVVGSLNANTDFRSGTDDGEVCVGGFDDSITTLESGLDGGVLELREVLAG